jgi:hypothetical protein
MMGNGLANIIAAALVAGAIVWNGQAGTSRGGDSTAPGNAADREAEFARWYARAVGDIRNDIVVNCGCCGDGVRPTAPKGPRESF